MRIEEGKTCKVFNRILLALKYLRQATWRQRVSRYLLQRLIHVCYKMLLFYILHSHSKAKLFGNDSLFVIPTSEGHKGRHIRQGSAVSPLWESGHVLTAILAIKED